MKTNKEKIESKFECDYDALSKIQGTTTFPTKCTLCGQIVIETWRKDASGSIEGGKAKQLRNYTARQRHLAHIHPVEFAQISSTFRQSQPYNNNKQTPCNSTAAKYDPLEMRTRFGPCLHCGKRYCFGAITSHRTLKSFDYHAGCREFGSLYNGSSNRWSPELVAAQQRKSTTVVHQTEVRQQFLDFVARGRDTIPLTEEEVNRPERIYGVYAQFGSMTVDGLQYVGRTKRFQIRTSTHEGDRSRYCTRGTVIPERTTLHVVSELTFCEHKCAEYFLIQLIDLFTEHEHRLGNEKLPFPWTPQSTSTQGARIQEENKAIHSEGRRLMAYLLVDAILLHQRGRREDVIDLERDPEAAVDQGEEGALAETPSTSRRKHYPRRKRPSVPDNLQLVSCSSASSSTAPTTPATPTTSTPTLAPELLEMQRKLEESEQRIREMEEDNKNQKEQRKRYKRKTHAFSTKMNKLAERFNASVSPMTSPGSLPSQPPSQPAPLPPPCFDPPKRTCLFGFHLKNDAKIGEFAGFEMPVQYDLSVSDSVLHTRSHVSIFDVSHMLQTEITGKHREEFIESLTPADLVNLPQNTGVLSVLSNPKGGIIDDLVISKTDRDSLYMVTNAGRISVDLSYFEESAAEWRRNGKDVLVKVLEDRALIAVQGPKMTKLLQPETDVPLDSLYFMHSSVGKVCGIDNCRVTRCGYTGEDGVEISVPVKEAELLVECLMASTNAKPKLAGLGAWDVLRIEAGLCLQGSDINEDITPVEAGIAFVIGKRRRQTMGFPGAEKMVEQLEKKNFAKNRVGLRMIGVGSAPRSHMPIVDPISKSAVGFVTSGCLSPTLGGHIAMGYVDQGLSKLGTILAIDSGSEELNEVELVEMPFMMSKYYMK